MQKTRIYLAAVAGLSLSATAAMQAAGQTLETRAVTVAVIEDYPAFSPTVSQQHPRARPLAAIVIRRYLADADSSIILLNPAHVDVATLARAVEALASCRPATPAGAVANLVPISPRTRPEAPPQRDAARLAAWLNELRAQPTSDLRRLGGGSGRAVTVEGLQACLPPAAPPRFRPGHQQEPASPAGNE